MVEMCGRLRADGDGRGLALGLVEMWACVCLEGSRGYRSIDAAQLELWKLGRWGRGFVNDDGVGEARAGERV